jgi:integrase
VVRGSTRKRGSTWTAYWDTPADPVTGKRRQASKGGFTTRKAAQAHLSTVLVAVAEGSYLEPSKQPFARFLLDEWLPGIRPTVRPLTAQRYERIADLYVAKRSIGGIPLRGLTGSHLSRL